MNSIVQNLIFSFSVFMLGASFGSFFKLTADRYSTSDSVIYKSSYCFSCKKNLLWYQNIPVFSYLFLKGKCAFCDVKIDPYSFLCEFITGVISLSFYYFFLFHGMFSSSGVLTSFLGVLFVLIMVWLSIFDLQHRVIPHKITYSSIFLFLLYFTFTSDSPLSPLKHLGIAFFFMDSIYAFTQLFRKQNLEHNNALLPILIWSLVFFFSKSLVLALLISILFLCLTAYGFQIKKSFINLSLWILLILLTGFTFVKFILIDFDFPSFALLYSGIGIVYLICEIVLYFLHLFVFSSAETVDDDESLDKSNIALGGGDITVFALISVYLGYIKAFFALFLASVLALVWISTVKLLFKDKIVSQFIPFVPFLALACFIIMMVFK